MKNMMAALSNKIQHLGITLERLVLLEPDNGNARLFWEALPPHLKPFMPQKTIN